MMPITENGIVIVKERTTAQQYVTIKSLWREVYKLRKDVERIGAELATMQAANAELQARLSEHDKDTH